MAVEEGELLNAASLILGRVEIDGHSPRATTQPLPVLELHCAGVRGRMGLVELVTTDAPGTGPPVRESKEAP